MHLLGTTLASTGILTRLKKEPEGSFYLVSTIHRTEFGGFYQTGIMTMPEEAWNADPRRIAAVQKMVYRIEVDSQLQSVKEHIDAVRMAMSKPERAWLGTKAYQNQLMDEVQNLLPIEVRYPMEMRWKDKRIRNSLSAAEINYRGGFFSRLF